VDRPDGASRSPLGGIIHTYQAYDPRSLPASAAAGRQPDLVSPAVERLLLHGSMRRFTPEELARAVRLDPSQIRGLGPSLDALIAMLEERKRRILATYETDSVVAEARDVYRAMAARMNPPSPLRPAFARHVAAEQLHDLEQLWYRAGDERSPFARDLLRLVHALGEKYQVDALAAKYGFTGRTALSIDKAIEIKAILEAIDRRLEELRHAQRTGQLAILDLEALAPFADADDLEKLLALRRQIEDYLQELAAGQGLEFTREGYQLSPRAYRLFQDRLLEEIFSDLQEARRGRHTGPVEGDGAVELPRTRPYEFGDSTAHLDATQSMLNAMIRGGREAIADPTGASHARRPGGPGRLHLRTDDLEVHITRHSPRCATAVILDMSGSMRYASQYVSAKRMALALDGLIRREYPGDALQFIEMYSLARLRHIAEVPALLPRPVTVFEPVVQLTADMSDERLSEFDIPPHFTNIQHALRLARTWLSAQGTPNRQVILITDGLPTAHFEGERLFLLYPPHQRTEAATLREAHLCRRDGITINVFLLPGWAQTRDDVHFAHRVVEDTGGRVFFVGGKDLDRYVVWDYVRQRRRIIG
jgi:uncharacterized protein with von Willebrand factor type A (vWA) domain